MQVKVARSPPSIISLASARVPPRTGTPPCAKDGAAPEVEAAYEALAHRPRRGSGPRVLTWASSLPPRRWARATS
jgi:hypothetical protein